MLNRKSMLVECLIHIKPLPSSYSWYYRDLRGTIHTYIHVYMYSKRAKCCSFFFPSALHVFYMITCFLMGHDGGLFISNKHQRYEYIKAFCSAVIISLRISVWHFACLCSIAHAMRFLMTNIPLLSLKINEKGRILAFNSNFLPIQKSKVVES